MLLPILFVVLTRQMFLSVGYILFGWCYCQFVIGFTQLNNNKADVVALLLFYFIGWILKFCVEDVISTLVAK